MIVARAALLFLKKRITVRNFPEIDFQFSLKQFHRYGLVERIKAEGDVSVRLFFAGIIEKVLDDGFLFGIHRPVFFDAGISVFIVFDQHILGAGAGGEHFHQKVRCAEDPGRGEFGAVADHHHIRLQDGLVIPVQLHIHRGHERHTGAFFLAEKIPQESKNLSSQHLMGDSWHFHIVKHPINQFYPLVIRQGQIILQGVAALPGIFAGWGTGIRIMYRLRQGRRGQGLFQQGPCGGRRIGIFLFGKSTFQGQQGFETGGFGGAPQNLLHRG